MSLGDIQVYSKDNGFGYPGEIEYIIATSALSPAQINSGEPVAKVLGASGAVLVASAQPLLGITYLVGIAATTSTDTASTAGVVRVMPVGADATYLISPNVASAYFGSGVTVASGYGQTITQTNYNTMVGTRVTFARPSTGVAGAYTINSTDASANCLVVEELDVIKFPGKVRFSIRKGCAYNA